MAALPSPTQVAGNHNAIYEAYYHVVDPNGFGTVGGMEAARFLKRSGLSDVILSKIWDLSDPGGRGCLDKSGMFVALKLVALVQNGKDLSINNVNIECSPPKMGDIQLPKPVKPPPPTTITTIHQTPLITSLPATAVDWTVKPMEKEKYEKLFDSLQPINGLLPGNKVKNVLLESKLPFDTLGKIWDLADQDKDGMLDRYEFISAMHLVYKALEKYAIPNTLPIELMPPTKRKNSTPISGNGVQPIIHRQSIDGIKSDKTQTSQINNTTIKPIQSVQPTIPWVVTADEKSKSDALFIKSDIDKDGFVSGQEIKDVFLQSGVPQNILAHIWGLCDIKQIGKLNNEQFALAMWLVARCLKGIEPPPALTPDMVPPSFRTIKTSDGLVENNNTRYSNPELDMISKDIEELAREKFALENDIAQKEADIKIKNGEIKSLQSELDTLAATLKQLENQKGEAQKRLNDLKAQKSEIENEMEKIDRNLEEQTIKVERLRTQAAEQAETVAAQESELNTKKQQLESLKQEEQRLEQQKNTNENKLENLTKNLQETQFSISQAKQLIIQLQEQTRQINDAIQICDVAIENNDPTQISDLQLKIEPEFRNSEYKKLTNNKQNGFDNDNNNDSKIDPFSKQNGPITGFNDDPFKSDPFNKSDAFNNDPFNSAFNKSNEGFPSDPFGSNSGKEDPFDAFGDSRKNSTTNTQQETNKDPFGCDPFAILHAPTRDNTSQQAPARPTSPSPALPPKKSKQPPPRPAPPRPMQPPKRSSQPDLFSSSGNDPFSSPSNGGGGFADFSDFDSKFSNNNKPVVKSTQKQQQTKGMDFTDDPFRDYRYEDPFNISFDDDPIEEDKNNNLNKSDLKTTTTTNNDNIEFDPFNLDGRLTLPLSNNNPTSLSASQLCSINDPFVSYNNNSNNNNNTSGVSGRASAPISLSEDQQLAWAAKESLKLEKDRKKRQLQEEADLELAISLSKMANKKL